MPEDEAKPKAAKPKDAEANVVKYFSALVQTGERWPTDEYDDAREAYEGDAKNPKRAGLYRSRVNTEGAYIDEEPADVHVVPAAGFTDDPVAKGLADCDAALWLYIRDKMGFREEIGKARHEAGVTDIGVVLHGVDVRRLLPCIRQIDLEDIRVDGDCDGDLKRAGWVSVYEYISPEMLSRDYPDIGLIALRRAASSTADAFEAPDDLDDHSMLNLQAALETTKVSRAKCRICHVYARNEFALFDTQPSEDDKGEGKAHFERYKDREGMTEPRRYVKFVVGLKDRPLEDNEFWPDALALDYDDWPITVLRYNDAHQKLAGFTDLRHEQVLLEDVEDGMGTIHRKSILNRGEKLGTGPACDLTVDQIKKQLERLGLHVFENAFDSQGNQKIRPLEFEKLDTADLENINILLDMWTRVSGIPDVRSGVESEEKRTATELTIQDAAATVRTNIRLRRFEAFQSEIAAKTLQMAHVICKKFSSLEVPNLAKVPEVDEFGVVVLDDQGLPVIPEFVPQDNIPWPQAEQLLLQPGTELIQLGVDAMVGPALAEAWNDTLPFEVIRQKTRVSVERGSTQRITRLQKVKTFVESYTTMIGPILQQLGLVDKQVDACRKVLELQDLDEFEAILPKVEEIQAILMQQAAAAAALPPAGTGEGGENIPAEPQGPPQPAVPAMVGA